MRDAKRSVHERCLNTSTHCCKNGTSISDICVASSLKMISVLATEYHYYDGIQIKIMCTVWWEMIHFILSFLSFDLSILHSEQILFPSLFFLLLLFRFPFFVNIGQSSQYWSNYVQTPRVKTKKYISAMYLHFPLLVY